MKNFTIAFLAAASLFSFGCKKKGGDDVAQAAAKMEQMASAMCECKDKACAEKVQADMVKWAEEMQKKYAGKEQPKPDEAMEKRIEAATILWAAGVRPPVTRRFRC